MPEGIVKWFDQKKGYGFIVDESRKDHFFHISGFCGDRKNDYPIEGDKVSYDLLETPRGNVAINIIKI